MRHSLKKAQLFLKNRRQPKCCFIWIPKTAGTSFFNWLRDAIGMEELLDRKTVPTFPNVGAVTFGHYHYATLVELGIVSRSYNRSSYKFAVVRNPYTRAISLYNYMLDKKKIEQTSFEKFLDDVHLNRPPIGPYNSWGLSQTNPQIDWLISPKGGLITDQVFRFENLDNVEAELSKRLGFAARAALPRLNTSKHSPQFEEMILNSRENIDKINEIYKRDFLWFDYEML
jgi:hypothetical protein